MSNCWASLKLQCRNLGFCRSNQDVANEHEVLMYMCAPICLEGKVTGRFSPSSAQVLFVYTLWVEEAVVLCHGSFGTALTTAPIHRGVCCGVT